jgi:hypothetical protein
MLVRGRHVMSEDDQGYERYTIMVAGLITVAFVCLMRKRLAKIALAS